jgi:hypothetical protein
MTKTTMTMTTKMIAPTPTPLVVLGELLVLLIELLLTVLLLIVLLVIVLLVIVLLVIVLLVIVLLLIVVARTLRTLRRKLHR